MASEITCPSCGEQQQLRGVTGPEHVTVTCLTCRATFERGSRACASCGREDLQERAQAMTRMPRGNQRAIIGYRPIFLCPHCDAEALRASQERNQPVPEEYVAAGHRADAAGTRETRQRGNSSQSALQHTVKNAPTAPKTAPEPAPSSSRPSTETTPIRHAAKGRATTRPSAASAPLTDPTVRQAIQAATEGGADVDPTVLVLLGTLWGSATRLSALDNATTATELAAWFDQRWPESHSPAATRAAAGVRSLLTYWGLQGWLTHDLARELPSP